MPQLMIRSGKTRTIAPGDLATASSGFRIASARPRMSRQRTRQGSSEAMSSTTKAARPLIPTLMNFRLFAMSRPPMSIDSRAALK